jgi:hypothetical protein
MFYQQVLKKWESRCSRLQAEITAEKSKYMKLRQQLERKANSTDDTVRFFYNIIHLYRLKLLGSGELYYQSSPNHTKHDLSPMLFLYHHHLNPVKQCYVEVRTT